jgi:hypothetical protein
MVQTPNLGYEPRFARCRRLKYLSIIPGPVFWRQPITKADSAKSKARMYGPVIQSCSPFKAHMTPIIVLFSCAKGLTFGSAVSISAILKITFLKIVFLKSLLFKIAQVFDKTG